MCYSQKVIFNAASIRHSEFANFRILSRFRRLDENSCMHTKFRATRTSYGNIVILKMAAVHRVGFSKLEFYAHA